MTNDSGSGARQQDKAEAAGFRQQDKAEAAGIREEDRAEAAAIREEDRAEAAWFRRKDRAAAAVAGAEAAVAGAEAGAATGAVAGAGAGAATGAAAGIVHAEAARDQYMTEGARRSARKLAVSLCILFAVVIGVGSAGLIFSLGQARINDCQRAVNTRFQQAEIDRANATRESAQAQIELWNALLALRGTQAQKLTQFNHAFSLYKAKLSQVTAIRFPPRTSNGSCSG